MADRYTGWKLLDKVTIVAKRMLAYDYKTGSTTDTGNVQGYIVDPSNKKQLETARSWGTVTTWEYFTDEEGRRSVRDKIEYKPEEYTYDNDGFTLELHNSADGSSQGGKLSFWNCWITAPDGRRFLVGIAADLLLDVLKNSTVVNGQVQGSLLFARCKGGVGMLNRTMESYKNALKDEDLKKKMSKGKTSKHILGHVYETTTERNVYFGKLYRWYEPVYRSKTTSIWASNNLEGFRRLEKPVELIFFPTYDEGKKFSEYSPLMFQCREKAPARREGEEVVEIDMTMDELIHKFEQRHIYDYYEDYIESGLARRPSTMYTDAIGLSSSNDTGYTLPERLRKIITEYGFKIIE